MLKEVPSLEFMTFTRIARLLWSGYDVQNSMTEYFLEGDQTLEKWSSIEESLKLKIGNCLVLPNKMKIALLSLVISIGGRIKYIIEHIYGKDYLPSNFMGLLKWTLLGIIDAKRTAEAVINDDNLPITKRYEIACTYCLEDEIRMLWRELPETNRDDYLNLRGPIYSLRYLPIYWTYYLRVELNSLDGTLREGYHMRTNCHCFGFLYACITVNPPAAEYFIGNMNVQEKEKYFQCYFRIFVRRGEVDSSSARNIYSCDIIYFLLSQLNENQQRRIFEKYGYHILKSFLVFPYEIIFLEIESAVRRHLTADQMESLKTIKRNE
ncbi:ANK_REP_REGION domain-containing protein [Trichonephila inaurata madagascariensis]|uniref:ANK_REP_REGION domain-containing protein n=1 Tax=Trichonephila inaurata madagascariensis TaxID=2747483 RepID=A0A8X6XZX1_9ARAC|nr:ANK_REP_REGION domain-containing protein [Trichonephila inaurata madagascariensis]